MLEIYEISNIIHAVREKVTCCKNCTVLHDHDAVIPLQSLFCVCLKSLELLV